MASSINASTTAGVVTTADTSGVLNIQTAGTTALTVDTTANVGIGTASPTQKLTVAGGVASSSGISALAASTAFFDYNSGNGRFAAVSATTGTAAPITLSQYSSNGSVGRDAVTINSSGNLQTIGTISVGNATPSTSGAGITFPATQSASTDANTLDDYEEGTWTLTDGSGAGLSITTTNAKYTKIGRLVYVSTGTITYPATASTANAVLSGLPFVNSAANAATVALVTTTAGANRALVVANASTVFFYANSSDTVSTNASLSGANIYGFAAVYQV